MHSRLHVKIVCLHHHCPLFFYLSLTKPLSSSPIIPGKETALHPAGLGPCSKIFRCRGCWSIWVRFFHPLQHCLLVQKLDLLHPLPLSMKDPLPTEPLSSFLGIAVSPMKEFFWRIAISLMDDLNFPHFDRNIPRFLIDISGKCEKICLKSI